MKKFQLVSEIETTDEIADDLADRISILLAESTDGHNVLRMVAEDNDDIQFMVEAPPVNVIKDIIGTTHEDKEVKIGAIQRLQAGKISIQLDLDDLRPIIDAWPKDRFFLYAETDGDL